MAGEENDELAPPQQQLVQQQLAAQQAQQEQLQHQMIQEAQARGKMESQLSQMQKMLEMLVGSRQESVNVPGPAADVSVNPVSSSFGTSCNVSGGTESSTTTTFSNMMSIPSASLARSTSFCSVPKIVEGMNFVDFKQKVMVWKKLVSDSIVVG